MGILCSRNQSHIGVADFGGKVLLIKGYYSVELAFVSSRQWGVQRRDRVAVVEGIAQA
jgi:hypothetical protein